ncbi:prepilin-type cleavage/methylation domain-containing protein [Vibrio rotiferianus]|jgi:type IV pilus assembly protein PilE|uniref:type IV pilin protein n=1 Tax=Vibrio rotiferianus TaxID=190895 RepID=UPI001110CC87|nr:type IV pilin protein [Vibrio rotiferianus]NOH68729.1 prepilin-type N-terminal cleavage/methylation domain-containing protein [Vibrio rotiferianus]TMX30670.1 prepilin-type cleavage/methylation domain-containing protein [Vibrio rotiferianus]TMX42388.1 prepilin-type cleavage/methylation domain-containing protein [Vibrio rotiferianus]TMX61785.1 prepilin-type cleavage/methylation domain-containing protein [Vibrio rotiferianus]CAH1534384.1 Type IV pilus biogenesis protein PilE [Vibrio rotiferian
MIRTNICNSYKIRLKGMTLVELLIAIGIMGALTAIAYPIFTNHVLKSHRTTAISDITRIQLELEASYNGNYDWSRIISGGKCTICDSDKFTFSVVSSAVVAYTITATAKLGQDKDRCFPQGVKKITLTSTNIESPSACWN